MPSIEITGGEQFAALAGRIRRAEGELPHELTQALERSAPPLIAAAKRSAAANLPRRGGLAGIVAASDMSTQPRAGGIRIVARGITQLPLTNTGFVRHPTFNHRTAKVTLRLSPALAAFEADFEGRIREAFSRGSVTGTLRSERSAAAPGRPRAGACRRGRRTARRPRCPPTT